MTSKPAEQTRALLFQELRLPNELKILQNYVFLQKKKIVSPSKASTSIVSPPLEICHN